MFESRRGHHPSFARNSLTGALIFLAVAAVYSGTLFAGFTNWDDPQYVLENPDLPLRTAAQWKSALTSERVGTVGPVHILSYGLEHRLWGLHPAGYHLTNVLLHATCAVLLWLLVRDLTGREGAATLAALIFALHPAGAEAVAWVTERKTLLAAVFMLASLIAYLRAEGEGAWRRALLAAFLFALAAGSKVAVSPYPVVLVALHVTRQRRLNAPRVVVMALSLAVAIASGLATVHAHVAVEGLPGQHGGSLLENARLVCVAFGRYATKLLFPVRLSPYYDFGRADVTGVAVGLGAALAAIAGGTTLAWLLRRRPEGFWAAGAWLLWLPSSSLLIPISTPMADRYLYLPLLFLAPLAAMRLETRFARGAIPGGRALALAVLICMGVLTARQASYWHSSLRLWAHAVQVDPDNPYVHQKLGYTLWKLGRAKRAVAEAREAVRLAPLWLEGWELLGRAALDAGEPEAAESAFRQQLGLAPNAVNAHVGVARARAAQDDARGALAAYGRALALKRDHEEAAGELAALARAKGLEAEALRVLPEGPTSVWIELARGDLLSSLGRRAEAERAWRGILHTRPGFVPALSRLAAARRAGQTSHSR